MTQELGILVLFHFIEEGNKAQNIEVACSIQGDLF
jgi:hypothetical protein